MATPAPKRKKPSPALKRAAKDLRKGCGDAGLAMEERRKIKDLEKKNAALKAKRPACSPPAKTKKTKKG